MVCLMPASMWAWASVHVLRQAGGLPLPSAHVSESARALWRFSLRLNKQLGA